MDARLTWVRLKAELKNWRKVGKESLPLLLKKDKEQNDAVLGKTFNNKGEGITI